MSSTNPLVSLPLKSLVKDLLRGEHYVSVSTDTAEVIYLHTRNKHTCHIQYPSDDDVDILGRIVDTPVLWDYGAWCMSSEKWLKSRLRSQRERDDRFILEANINLLSRCILRIAYINPDAARMIARKCINDKDSGRIRAFGCKKLYTKIEELP